jgi:hypothetical protein
LESFGKIKGAMDLYLVPMLERFEEVVNSQSKYNTVGINAVPILI